MYKLPAYTLSKVNHKQSKENRPEQGQNLRAHHNEAFKNQLPTATEKPLSHIGGERLQD